MHHSVIIRALVHLVLLVALVFPPVATTTASSAPAPTGERYSSVLFVENVGQLRLPDNLKENEKPRFQIRGAHGTFYFAPNAIWVTVADATKEEPTTLRLSFVDANLNPHIVGVDRLATHVSYYFGNDPAQWHEEIPVWGGVRYENLYPGWDLEITSADGRWEWKLLAKRTGLFESQSDLKDVRLRVEGADKLTLNETWINLLTRAGEFSLPLLQAVGSKAVSGLTPALKNSDVFSPFGPAFRPLNRPPANHTQNDLLYYSTYLGGTNDDCNGSTAHTRCSIALGTPVGTDAIAYISGVTFSSDFPRLNAYDNSYDGLYDVFVTKLKTDGSGILYSTYLGGTSDDYSYKIAVNGQAAHIVGWTTSSGFPTTPGAFDTVFDNTNQNPFVVKLSSTGTLLYSTFLGSGQATGVAVTGNGRIHVVGQTTGGFTIPPGMNVYDSSHNGGFDFFIAKLNPVLQGAADLLYYTYLGGAGQDCEAISYNGPECDIALDASGEVYVVGATLSADLTSQVVNGFDTSCGTDGNCNPVAGVPIADLFVAVFNLGLSGQSALLYSTYLGGSGGEECYQCAIAALAGKIYVTGDTTSTNFPFPPGGPTPVDASNASGRDVFVSLIDSTLSGAGSHLYSTYLGLDSSNDSARDIWVANDGTVYITGATFGDFPTTPDAFDESANLFSDAYVTKLDLSLGESAILYSTYLGDSNNDYGGGVTGISTHSQSVYVVGSTASTNFPHTNNAFQTAPPPGEPVGKHNAFVTRLAAPPSWSTSYYAGNLDELAALGTALGNNHKSRPGTQDEVVILALGVPDKQNGQFGMTIYNNDRDLFESVDRIRQKVVDFAVGYKAQTDSSSTLRIVVGASNQVKNLGQPLPGQFNFNDPVSAGDHGQAWADMVDGINSDLQNLGCCGGQVIVISGSDIERLWADTYISPPYSTIRWVEAYRDASSCSPATAEAGCLYNFGNNDGPPHINYGTYCTGPDSNDSSDTWTQCDLWYVSWGVKRTTDNSTFARPLPEIYNHDIDPPFSPDANAKFWQETSAFGGTSPMYFVGTLTQYAACSQPGFSCGPNEDNTQGQGWIQLWGSLYSNRNPPGYTGTNTRQTKLRWSTDIRYQCGSLFHSCP